MKLPDFPNATFIVDMNGEQQMVFDQLDMLQFQRDTVEACCQVLLESGFKSNGVPAYEHLVDKLRSMK